MLGLVLMNIVLIVDSMFIVFDFSLVRIVLLFTQYEGRGLRFLFYECCCKPKSLRA